LIKEKKLVQIVESAIGNLITTFKKSPYFFYAESDLHCYLYSGVFNELPLEDWQCKTKDGKLSILLHKEYPTKERYSAKTLKEKVPKGACGPFDLSIWNPKQTEERLFRVEKLTDFKNEQQTFIAIEFDLIEGNDSLGQAVHHFKWDLLKLRSVKNEVEYGYSLVFVRDWVHKDLFLKKVRKEVAQEHRIAVLYAEKSEDRIIIKNLSKKSFLNYEPMFK
jgi:hypothetical protein